VRDGALVEFQSFFDGVRCAVAIPRGALRAISSD
jgi:hypothetical protein